MKTLVIGGTRFIGRAVVNRLKAEGHDVCVFTRGKTALPEGVESIQGDINELGKSKNDLLDYGPDHIIHMIAFTEKHALDFAHTFKTIKPRVTVISSADCYDAFQQYNRGREVADFPIDEEAPITGIQYYLRDLGIKTADPHYDKNLMTSAILKAQKAGDLTATVYRLPMVFGPGDPQINHRHGEIIRRLIDKRPYFVVGTRRQAQIFTFGYVDNVAAAIVHGINKSKETEGKIYNLGEPQVRTYRRWAGLYAKVANFDFQFKVVPDEMISENRGKKDAPTSHIIIDSSKFSRETDFEAPVSLSESIRRTLEWGTENQASIGSLDYERENLLVTRYEQFLSPGK